MAWRHIGRETGTERAEPDRWEEFVSNSETPCGQKVRFSFYRGQRTGRAECPRADCPAVRRQTGEPCVSEYDLGFFESVVFIDEGELSGVAVSKVPERYAGTAGRAETTIAGESVPE